MCGFLVIISAQVWCCYVSSIVAALTLIMAAPLSVCIKEEQRSVIRFSWSEGVSGAAILQRLSAQYWNSVLPQQCLRLDWKVKKCRTNITHDKGARRPSMVFTEDNIERTHGTVSVLLDECLLMKWHMFCKLAMVRAMEWCTWNLGFIKSVQDGYQNNSQRCINKRAWTYAKNVWIATNETCS